MKATLLIVAAAGTLAATIAFAQSGAEVIKAKGCLTCHEVDKKKIGPSFKDIAAKYRGDKAAAGRLVTRLKDGKDHAKVAASDAEIKAAVQHVLATK